MSGAIIFCSGGPLTWKAVRQDCIALSSCKAKIQGTIMGSCLMINTRNMISDQSNGGYPINNAAFPTPLYNNNDVCVKWCHNMTSSHIELKENVMHKWVKDGTITIDHVSGKCNPSDIFTKEMCDGANFQ
jgi:hypothetical protein